MYIAEAGLRAEQEGYDAVLMDDRLVLLAPVVEARLDLRPERGRVPGGHAVGDRDRRPRRGRSVRRRKRC